MKKTLMTLAALAMASVASATTLSDMTKLDTTSPTKFDTAYSYSFTLVLDWDTLTDGTILGTDENHRNTILSAGANGVSMWWKTGVKAYYNNTEGLVLNIHEDEGPRGDVIKLAKDSYNYGASDKLVLTYTFDGATEVGTLYALTTQGGIVSTQYDFGSWSQTGDTSASIGDFVTSSWVYDGVIKSTEVAAISTAAVPEPTTATLSLLALAGLAARRRRK